MKLSDIFVLITLSVMVEGAWWAAAAQPVILSLGAIWTALDSDVLDTKSIELKKLLPLYNK